INGVERPVKAAELFAFTLRVRAGNTDVLTDAEENVRRSEERRVGKECRSRWLAYHLKKKREGRIGSVSVWEEKRDGVAGGVGDSFEYSRGVQTHRRRRAR